jgi:hypothetical protein
MSTPLSRQKAEHLGTMLRIFKTRTAFLAAQATLAQKRAGAAPGVLVAGAVVGAAAGVAAGAKTTHPWRRHRTHASAIVPPRSFISPQGSTARPRVVIVTDHLDITAIAL